MDLDLQHMPNPKCATAWLVEAPGLPTKVCVGSFDCPAEVHVSILSCDTSGYARAKARRVGLGGIAIEPNHTDRDQSYSGQGGTFRFMGERSRRRTQATNETAVEGVGRTSTWKVTTPKGCMLFVMAHGGAWSDAEVRSSEAGGYSYVLNLLRETLEGPCSLQRVDASQFTAMPTIVPPDMNLIMVASPRAETGRNEPNRRDPS